MAPRRCSVVLLSISILSLVKLSDSQETAVPVGQSASAPAPPQTAAAAAEQRAERRWEETEVGSAAAEKAESLKLQTVAPSSETKPKDDFQEELVIRPLHSGDIYASFQFRTRWKTDFREDEGKLSVSFHSQHILMCNHFPSETKAIFNNYDILHVCC